MRLRRLLHAHREGWMVDDLVGVAARLVVEDARQCGASIETALVALKQAWWALDETRGLALVGTQDLLARVVTSAIHGYFASARPPVTGAALPESTIEQHTSR